jgi:HK97 gp10 family phage protein
MPVTVTSRIPQVTAALPVRLDAALEAGARLVEGRAKGLAPDAPPIGEGLVDAIHSRDTGLLEWAVVGGDRDAFYGHFLELGTVKMAHRPFLLPAFEGSVVEITQLASAAVRGL